MKRAALGLVCLVMLLNLPGCTWTETYRDYPPGLGASDDHHHHNNEAADQ
jgi:hypothetical protein